MSALLSTLEFLSDGHRQHGFHPVLPNPFIAFLFSGKYTASPHVNHKPSVEPRHMKRSQVLESVDVSDLDGWGDFGLQITQAEIKM